MEMRTTQQNEGDVRFFNTRTDSKVRGEVFNRLIYLRFCRQCVPFKQALGRKRQYAKFVCRIMMDRPQRGA